MKKASYPTEYVCLFSPDIPTEEGDGFVFMAIDVYSKYAFMTGVERDREKANVLKHIKLLVEHNEFTKYRGKPFTLVLHKYEELRADIEDIIKPHGGSMIVDGLWVTQEFVPLMESLFKNLANRKN